MAWNIAGTGTREGVIKLIQAAKVLPEGSDQSQLDAIKPLLEAEVNALPAEFNAARIDASGDSQKNARTFQFNILALKLAL